MRDIGRIVIPLLVLGMIAVVAVSPVIGFDQRPRLYAIDGDSIDAGGERWRLRYIDAPEMGRCRRGRTCAPGDPHAAKRELQRWLDRGATCHGDRLDRYGRFLVECWHGRTNVNRYLLDHGYAMRWPPQRKAGP